MATPGTGAKRVLLAAAIVLLLSGAVAALLTGGQDDDEIAAEDRVVSTTTSTPRSTTTSRPTLTTVTTSAATSTTVVAATTTTVVASTTTTDTPVATTTTVPTSTTAVPSPIPADGARFTVRNELSRPAQVLFFLVERGADRADVDGGQTFGPFDLTVDDDNSEELSVRVGGVRCSGGTDDYIQRGREYRVTVVSVAPAEAPPGFVPCDGDRGVFLRLEDLSAGTPPVLVTD